MKPGRAFKLLMRVGLLGAIASFNEMTPDAQASFLDGAGQTAQGTLQSLQLSGVATYQAVTDELMDASAQERPARVLAGGMPSRIGARSNAEPPAAAGNPLWALPLEQLSITRERPVFSPSRRPPPPKPTPAYVAPVAVPQPVKPPEPERPAVSLIGTVIGSHVRIGVFLETATQSVSRVRVGEDHQGWVLRLVKAREATLVKGVEQTLVLEPSPGAATARRSPNVPPPVPNSIGTIPILNTADYVDEQPLPARGARRQGH